MKPLTPAMVRALRHIRWRVDEAHILCIGDFCHGNTIKALQSRGLIEEKTLPCGWRRWEPTPAGRKVLAEQETETMKPPTPAQLQTLRRLAIAPGLVSPPSQRRVLETSGWVTFRGSLPFGHITDSGRKVLAEQETET